MRSVDPSYFQVYPGGDKRFIEDCKVLAMLALFEHSADDDESVSSEWLDSVGAPKSRANSDTLVLPFNVDGWHRCITVSRDYVRIDGITVIVLPTRGNVRRLCRELGIELKE